MLPHQLCASILEKRRRTPGAPAMQAQGATRTPPGSKRGGQAAAHPRLVPNPQGCRARARRSAKQGKRKKVETRKKNRAIVAEHWITSSVESRSGKSGDENRLKKQPTRGQSRGKSSRRGWHVRSRSAMSAKSKSKGLRCALRLRAPRRPEPTSAFQGHNVAKAVALVTFCKQELTRVDGAAPRLGGPRAAKSRFGKQKHRFGAKTSTYARL